MPRWLRTFIRLALVLSTTCATAVLGLIAFRAVAPVDTLARVSGELSNYLQTVGGRQPRRSSSRNPRSAACWSGIAT
jgi:hypothetical protein